MEDAFSEFSIKLVGVSFDNEDGTSRQDILRECKKYENVFLTREYDNQHDKYAISVGLEDGNIIGYIPKGDIRLARHIDQGFGTESWISKLIGKPNVVQRLFGLGNGKKIGCVIMIRKLSSDLAISRMNQYHTENREIEDLIRKAKKLEKENLTKSINLYKESIVKIIQFDTKNSHSKFYRFSKIPVNRLTLLLEKNKDIKEALDFIEWYEEYNDANELYSTDYNALEKRKVRLGKKRKKNN